MKASVARLKKKAWVLFSKYIRRKYADFEGYASCVTCGTRKKLEELHAGHFVQGRGNAVLFDERGVFPQCYVCNVRKHGSLLEYLDFMNRHYGEEAESVIADLRKLGKQSKQFTIQELENLVTKFGKVNDN